MKLAVEKLGQDRLGHRQQRCRARRRDRHSLVSALRPTASRASRRRAPGSPQVRRHYRDRFLARR